MIPGLGTVQLGLPYGRQAKAPLMPEAQSFEILKTALDCGIKFFDTAIGYGLSEERIGKFGLAQKGPDIEISTKISKLDLSLLENPDSLKAEVRAQLFGSFQRLGLKRMGLLQFHDSRPEFFAHPVARKLFQWLKGEGHVERIGISIYTEEEAEAACRVSEVDALQIPVSVVDRRFVSGEVSQRIKERGLQLIGRSIFLQGLLVEGSEPPDVRRRAELLEFKKKLETAVRDLSPKMGLREIAIKYIFGNLKNKIDVALMGADHSGEIRENLALAKGDVLLDLGPEVLDRLRPVSEWARDKKLLNPALWT